ncbi:MAG: hypothetical protein K8R90_02795 [Candidatus Cloacimonetes bacterium]|nr:hypothetical protein [Candidatus Cloacimonadota bacterium]
MKYSLTRRIRGFIITILLLCVALVALLQITRIDIDEVQNAQQLEERIVERQKEIQNICIIFLVFIFIVGVVFFFNVSGFQSRSLTDLRHLLQEIARGNYNLAIDTDVFEERNDAAVQELIELTAKAVSTVSHFDQAKKEKIVEHLGRIQAMLKLTENGYIILTFEGQIKFISDNVIDVFPVLSTEVNVRESNFPPEVDNTVIRYINDLLRDRGKAEPQQYFIPALKRHITLRSAVVRDTGGIPIGAVVGLYNIEKRKGGKEHDDS